MPVFFQPAHHAGGGIQAPGAAAGQQDGVDLVDQVGGVQQVGFARAGAAPRTSTPATAPSRAQHHGAAGGAAGIGVVADRQAQDVGDGVGRVFGDLHLPGIMAAG
jgi:hypothetical protein